jgi:predicted extracellular nuclease
MKFKFQNIISIVVMLGLLFPTPVFAAEKAHVADPSPSVFINEIHYDNDGTDTGEAIEIAGPAGTDLSGWSLILYNGANGEEYGTTALSGTIPDQENGYGTIAFSYPENGLQNGAPDGVALVDASSNVLMFLSYEGEFAAVEEAASGLTSTNIGVSESATTPLDYSLQLSGSGTVYGDFTWAAQQTNTFGAVNTGQSFTAAVNEPVVLNCGGTLTVTEGDSASTSVSASDADGIVTNIAISAVTPDAEITLSDLVAAGSAGDSATAVIHVADTVSAGTYIVSLTASNNDGEPQTGTCDLTVEVQPVVNEPVVLTCGDSITVTEGVAAATPVSASDADGIVTDISISTVSPAADITLSDLVPAANAGDTTTATVNIADTVPAGSYVVSLLATNNDAEPQTATCNLMVEVQPVNEPVLVDCGETVTLNEGDSATTSITASDADGIVTELVIGTIIPDAPITLGDVVPAAAVGESATAVLTVDSSTPAGSYVVSIVAANYDAEPQTGTCDLTVEVLETVSLPDVHISEFHYDNAGTDSGEIIEVYGPAGTDLTGWTIVLYNGNGGAMYGTLTLSGVLVDQKNGLGTATVAASGLQNGSPDGMALVAPDNTVVEFLSYEGVMTAADGPAAGLTSTDVGVSEPSDSLVGLSLQIINGVWVGPIENTFGAINHYPIPDLVINEIDYDQPSTDTAEFIEIYNPESTPATLSGWTLDLVNGNGAVVYLTITLPEVELAAGDYYVVCANAATVANCDLDVTPDTNLIQNGAPDAVALLYDGEIMDAVSYEGDTAAPYVEGSGDGLVDTAAENQSISRCPNGSDTDQNNVDFVLAAGSPGEANSCAAPDACGNPFTPIYEVQGNGSASPLAGTEVTVEGIVTADFQLDTQLNAFYLQDASGDGDPSTSDGIYVFHGASSDDVNVGDYLRIRGTVSEYYEKTELSGLSLVMTCSTGNSVTPTPISLPLTSQDDLEPYEGMLVTFPQTLYIAEYFEFARYGEIVLAGSRQFTPSGIYDPGSPDSVQLTEDNLLNRIKLGDARTIQNPDPAMHPDGAIFDLTNRFRGGDTLNNVTGVLDYNYDEYKIQLTNGAEYTATNPRQETPDDVGGNVKVASFNVLNYFTTLGSRGADTAEEFERQRAKIIAAISTINADVVGLIEIENNTEAIQNLVNGLNVVMGEGTYAYIDTGIIGTDEIKVAFIYKPATVSPVGDYAILDSSVDARFLDTYNRPALAQTFQHNITSGRFTAVVNHLKSKGSDCNDIGDPDLGDGAGNCNVTRTLAAEALMDWIAADPTGSGSTDFLIIGDLNSYDKEDPIDTIKQGSDDLSGTADDFTDMVYEFNGEYAYSYVFDGQLGYLDHALGSSSLLAKTTGVIVWHINADEPDILDYDMTYKADAQDLLYEPNAFRSSDHDPVIIGLDLCEYIPPKVKVRVNPGILWPANHKYVRVKTKVFATDNVDPNPTITLLSVTSNEPDDGIGDGNTINDIVILDDSTFLLRAERSTFGHGRVYTITYQVTDYCGNSTIKSVYVLVPRRWGW